MVYAVRMQSYKVLRGGSLSVPAPENAMMLHLAGGGQRVDAIGVVDGAAVVDSANLIPNVDYVSEWTIDLDGTHYLKRGPVITVEPSISAGDVSGVVKPPLERMYDAAVEALLSASSSGVVSFNTGDQSYSFQTRQELLEFVNSLSYEMDAGKRGGKRRSRKVML